MKPTKILTYVGAVVVVVILVFSLLPNTGAVQEDDYTAEVIKYRQEKNEFMRNDEKSPFIEQKVPFDSLKYFKIDETFKLQASVETIPNGEIKTLATSSGEEQKFVEIAILHFDLKNTHQDLTLLQNVKSELYFLSFYDETSAITTYGSGRYLEIDYKPGETRMELDFNYAYNPYCAYTSGYSCPVPPLTNQMSVAIAAGEKNYD
jgi:hypothetical protein